ncbi:Bullous pemphigoid antigen 1 [Temnothorax longispinosus]|uniref:Bullous pemphigoid antigen 1 n=1 Tax=Temnothorax longispinosus TaxID=300112 RepID=A0A4S2J9E6_9HYME|nr:Bullous pemphigoid antigen 1 [Temnothorax longispinosus]
MSKVPVTNVHIARTESRALPKKSESEDGRRGRLASRRGRDRSRVPHGTKSAQSKRTGTPRAHTLSFSIKGSPSLIVNFLLFFCAAELATQVSFPKSMLHSET